MPAPPTSVNRTMTAGEWVMLLALALLWGLSFPFASIAVTALPPLTIVTLRVGIAALMLNALLQLMRLAVPTDAKTWGAFLVMGLLNNVVPFSLIVWSQTHIPGGLASILNATTPLLTALVAHACTDDEKLTGNRLAGVLIGFCGVAVMIGPAALRGLGSDVVAQLAVIAAALSYALAGIYGRRFRRMGIAPVVAAAGQVTAAALMLLPIALLVERPWTLPMPGFVVCGAVLGQAVFSTTLAYILYFRILATAGATNLLLVTFLMPIVAAGLGTLALGERLGPGQWLGLALISAGLAAIDGRAFSPLRRDTAQSR
jgi:drug/metabolite transporter (DMT)-like permease